MDNMNCKSKNRICRKNRDDGFVLLLSLFLLIILSILGAGLLWLGMYAGVDAVRTTSKIKARTATDAAHELACFRLKKFLSENQQQLPKQTVPAELPGGDQKYTFIITPASGGGYDISATGHYGRATHTVTSRARAPGGTTYGLCVNQDIYFHGGTIDAYNSENGPYGPGNQGLPLEMGMNGDSSGDFYMGALANVPSGSKLTVGPDAEDNPEIVKSGQGVFDGEIVAGEQEIEFPPVIMNTQGLPNKGTLTGGTITEGKYLYQNIQINQYGNITIKGHVTIYLNQGVHISQYGSLQVANDGDSSLALYCNGQFMVNQANVNTLTKAPKTMKIFGAPGCGEFHFSQNPEFYGMIYAPNARLMLNMGNLHGAFMGKSAYVDRANIHYDKALDGMSLSGAVSSSGSDITIERWQEN